MNPTLTTSQLIEQHHLPQLMCFVRLKRVEVYT